ARFAIGAHVRQEVVWAKSLAPTNGADAPRDVQFFGDGIFPDGVDGAQVTFVPGEGGDVGHAAVKVTCANSVTDSFGLVDRFDAGLMVIIAAWAADIEEEFCQSEIAGVSGDTIELGETHFDDFVAGPNVEFFGTESIAKQIGFLDGNVEEI